jgi:hypothetical protein
LVTNIDIQTLPALLEDSWNHSYPGRETAVRNELMRSFVSSADCYAAVGQSSFATYYSLPGTSLILAEMQRLRSIAERAVACKPLKCISNSY